MGNPIQYNLVPQSHEPKVADNEEIDKADTMDSDDEEAVTWARLRRTRPGPRGDDPYIVCTEKYSRVRRSRYHRSM